MKWMLVLVSLYLVYYTFVYCKMVWKEGKKFSSFVIMMMLGGSLVALPAWLYFIR